MQTETKVAHLRNILTPIKNYFSMLKADKNNQVISTLLLDKEADNCIKVLPEILELMDKLPPHYLGFFEYPQYCNTCDYFSKDVKKCKKCASSGLEKRTNHSDNYWNGVIVDARIVSDTTFATRLHGFLSDVETNDCISCEELEYLKTISEKLLKFQQMTASDEKEIEYLNTTKKGL